MTKFRFNLVQDMTILSSDLIKHKLLICGVKYQMSRIKGGKQL